MCKKLFLPVILLLVFAAASAQSNYVALYEDCNYSGKKYFLEAGNYNMNQMKIGNDMLSSMQIPAGMKVTIYEDDDFKGRSKTFYSSITCLDDKWNDVTSSIVVESENRQPHYGQNDYVIFYNDCDAKGYSQTLRPGRYSGNQLGNSKYNISSFTIYGNLRVKAYLNNDNLSGYSVIHDASESCLISSENDKIGSLIIEYKPSQPTYSTGGTGNYATIYTDCNYRGNSLRLAPGYYQGDKLGLLKFDISSIEIPSNLRAKVYVDNEYLAGSSYTLSENISCMNSSLNDRIGSLIIEENNGYNQYPSASNEKVILYEDKDYGGRSAALLPGAYNTMTSAGFLDKALSSLKIPDGYRVVLYEKENLRGRSYTLTASREGLVLLGWNDRASSIAVYRDR